MSLPEWRDAMSDGCSSQAIARSLGLQRLAPTPTPAQCKACVAHDRDYYIGGTRSMRRMADELLRRRLLEVGMEPWRAWFYWIMVRLFGGPRLHRFTTWAIGRPQAWAWGGGVFAYTRAKD